MPDTPHDNYTVPQPVFTEWSHYNIDYQLLFTSLSTEPCSDAPSARCQTLVREYSTELERIGSFVHLKGAELEAGVQTCAQYLGSLNAMDYGEQLVYLGQAEETVGAAMAQTLALARLRRANFSALYRILDKLRHVCPVHHAELLDALAASPLFGESSLETQLMFRISQIYDVVQGAYEGGVQDQCLGRLQAFPNLALWRGWVDPRNASRVHRRLCAKLTRVPPPDRARQGQPKEDLSPRMDPPPSPPQTNPSVATQSPVPCAIQIDDAHEGRATLYFDTKDMGSYCGGLSPETADRETLELFWSEQDAQIVTIEQHACSGPWQSTRTPKASALLESRFVVPFLNSEFNFDNLHTPAVAETETKAQQRQRIIEAQRIQRSIIMNDLKPLLLASEERTEYVDLEHPGVRVVLRRNVTIAHDSQMADSSWLEAALRAHPTGRSESLPFALFELHLDGHAELPAWLGQMFFESSLVRPVLDFDLYLHGIALLRGDLVDDLPYWLVDYHRDLLHPKSTVPSLRTTSSQSTKSVAIDVPQLPTETTELLGGPRRNLSPCQRLSLAHSLRIGVLGDLHVAKSELVHKICHPRSATPAATSDWAGPTVDILDFHRPSANANAWIEFIVFPSETKHPLSRQMLYGAQIDAVFLVCDCTLPRTFVHGYKWMEEAVQVLEEGATVPVAVILGGPTAIDIGIADAVQKLIEPLVDTYKAIVLD
ncbi:hypothetical protein EC988_004760, partial [Linderina pennispora]